MSRILSIVYYTVIENIRNKVFYVIILFGISIISMSFLLAALGGEQPVRILLDLGLVSMEFFALLTAIFAAVTLVLEEMESKTVYLILTRPVSRSTYIIGRYIGLLSAVYIGMSLMCAMHLTVLLIKGWPFTFKYFIAVFLSMEKIAIVTALALFFSLFSTSAISSLSFTLAFWVLGHFSQEMMFLGRKATFILTKLLAKIMYYVVPNMQLFNFRDFWDIPFVLGSWVYLAVIYGFVYTSICLLLSFLILKNKEF